MRRRLGAVLTAVRRSFRGSTPVRTRRRPCTPCPAYEWTTTETALPVTALSEATLPKTALAEAALPETTLSKSTLAKSTLPETSVSMSSVSKVSSRVGCFFVCLVELGGHGHG